MVSKTQKFRLGIFIIFISALMIIFFVMVAGNKLMEKRDSYHIVYKEISISGLQIGGAVKYHGISIGRVDDILIDKEDIRNVIVKVSVKAGTPIKEDVKASLIPVGITGLLQVELSGGSNEAKLLKPGSEILAGTSTFESISGKAEIITEKLENVLHNLAELTNQNNRHKLENILANIDSMITENREPAASILTNIDSTTFYLVHLTEQTKKTAEKLNEILYSERFNNILNNTEKFSSQIAEADIQQLIVNLNKAVNQANDTLLHFDLTLLKSRQDFLQSLETLKETMDYLNEFSRQISENPSILLRPQKK